MKQELNPGDIIFIQDEKYKYPHHVGIFINKEQYMHAVNSNDTGKDGCVKKGRIEKKGRIITNAFRFTLEQGPITRSKSKAENKITSENLIKKVLETAEYLEIFKTLYSSKRADEAKKLIKEIMKNQANSSETQDRINPQKIEDINPRTKENKIIEDIGKFFVYKGDKLDD